MILTDAGLHTNFYRGSSSNFVVNTTQTLYAMQVKPTGLQLLFSKNSMMSAVMSQCMRDSDILVHDHPTLL